MLLILGACSQLMYKSISRNPGSEEKVAVRTQAVKVLSVCAFVD